MRSGKHGRIRSRLVTVGATALVITGLTILASAGSASAAGVTGTLTLTPSTGLTNGTSVAVAGSGFTASSIGNLLECNNAPNEPTVTLGSPINSDVGVGCSAPSLTQLVQTDSTGAIKAGTTFKVVQGTVGPPCGAAPAAVTCPATDSAGQSPTADAANYPCPPTAAQQAAGVICQLNYGDAAGDSAMATLSFQGSTPATTAPPTTVAPTTATTKAATTATTVAPATGAGGGSATPTTAAAAASGTLAATGPGRGIGLLGVVGGVLLLFGLLLLLVMLDIPQRAFAGVFDREGNGVFGRSGVRDATAPVDHDSGRSLASRVAKATSSRSGGIDDIGHRLGNRLAGVPGVAQGLTHRVVSVSSRTAAWLLGR